LSPERPHPARRAAHLLLVLLAAGLCAPAAAREPSDATTHHSFSDVERWKKVFDDPERDTWQKPDALVAALALRPGMAVADLGAGTGYLSRRLSAAVGPAGTVFAADVEPALVVQLRERAEQEGTANVTPVLASAGDPRLPAGGVDVVLVLDTYHHIDDRPAYFRRLARALRPGGRVVVIDWQKRKLPVGPPPDHKLPRAQVVEEMAAAGYTLAGEPDVLPYQYFLVFRPTA
jgi:ubiquinone/menaquinone biosynthesis C-methylase UbiE